MKKKIVAILFVFVLMLTTFSNAYGVELLNLGIYETAYRLSKDNDINLPFINVFDKSATYDKTVKHSGITFGETTIDVEDKLEGVHAILTDDMVTIKGEVEHGVILANNVVVEGKISDDTVIIAKKVQVMENAVVERDIVIVSTDLDVLGTVKGNLIAASLDAKVSGTIEQDLRIVTGTLNLENSTIKGKLEAEVGFEDVKQEIISMYPEAVVELNVKEDNSVNVVKIVLKGIKTVLVYTFIAAVITKKNKSVATKMSARFMENSTFGILSSAAVLTLAPLLLIVLTFAGVVGLGIIAWPVLIIFTAVILLALVTSQLIVGLFIYEVIKKKASKYRIPTLAIIYTVLFALTQIPVVYSYAIVAISLVALGIVLTYIFKRNETSEFIDASEDKVVKIEEEKQDKEVDETVEQTKVEQKDNSKKKNKKN
ncbi:MAG: hypothetical protein IKL08_06530, partial [Clostridia bacterium]|nr:hypothetical protein [Clostridia bacterium]